MAAFCYYKIKDYNQTLIMLDEYLELAENSSEIDYYKGLAYYYLNDFNNSARHLKKALKTNQDNSEMLLYLGLNYHYLNKNRESRKVLNKLYYIDRTLHDSLNFVLKQ